MCGPDRVPFRPSRFNNGPFFYLKIGLDIGRKLQNAQFSMNLWVTYSLLKSKNTSNLHGKKKY